MGAEKIEKSEPEKKLEEKVAPLPLPQYAEKIDEGRKALADHSEQKIKNVSKFKPNPEDRDRLKNDGAKDQLALAEAQSVTLAQVGLAKKSIEDTVKSRLSMIFLPSPGIVADLGNVKLAGLITPDGKIGVMAGVVYENFQFGVMDMPEEGKKLVFRYSYNGDKIALNYQGAMGVSNPDSIQNTLSGFVKLPKDISLVATVNLNVGYDKDEKKIDISNYGAALGVKFGPTFSNFTVTKTADEFIQGVNLGLRM